MSNHVKIFVQDFSLRRQRPVLPWHPLLALGRRQPSPLAMKWYCTLWASVRAVDRRISVIQSLRASLKKRHACACILLAAWKFITANQSKPEGRSHLGQQQQQFSTIAWTWDVVWNVIVAISECAQTSGRQCLDILSYGKMLSMMSHTHFPSIISFYLMLW